MATTDRPGRLRTARRGRSDPGDLETLVSSQRGAVSRRQLELGLKDGRIDRWLASGRLHAVHAGVYLVGHPVAARDALEHAALLAVPGSALADRTAGTQHLMLRYRGRIELITAQRTGRDRPGLILHRCPTLTEDDVVLIDGLRVTSPGRTLADLAHRHPALLKRALNEAERHQLHVGDLRARTRGKPGAKQMRRVLDAFDPLLAQTASPPEERLLDALLNDPRRPRPLVNHALDAKHVDFCWPQQRLVVEVDGDQDHLRRAVATKDRADDRALRNAGWRVSRYPAHRIDHDLDTVVAEIDDDLAAA